MYRCTCQDLVQKLLLDYQSYRCFLADLAGFDGFAVFFAETVFAFFAGAETFAGAAFLAGAEAFAAGFAACFTGA